MLRKLVYVILIAFLVLSSAFVYTLITSVNSVERAVIDPVGGLVRNLFIRATPVILPNPSTIVHQINELSRLETASVELEKVITAERNSDVLWGALGETMVFVAHGRIIAGVDFAEMDEHDLRVVDPDTVWVHLPDALIFEDLPALDNERSFVADRDTGILTRADADLETEVRRIAESTIRSEAQETGVVELADRNAQRYMRDFLNSLGFENIEFYDETPPEPPPFEPDLPKGYVPSP